jgi:iron complex outermembrane receptor protein
MLRPLTLALCLGAALPAHAQTPPPSVLITGNPLRDDRPQAAASVLQGTPLLLRRGVALGETLDGLPGVAATYFGPNANRPVIRGQDGDRIRLLSNGAASLDASALSFDHAVPIDPLVVERIEVLRGPAALLYGGSAVGGVVNTVDNRIPTAPVDGLGGAAELRLGGAAQERGGAVVLETGGQGFAWHADAFVRRTDDLAVPAYDRPDEGGSTRADRVLNSASRAEGGAVGGSWQWQGGHFGLSLDTYRNHYGVVAEEDVTIRMRRDRLAVSGETPLATGALAMLRGHLALTDYTHTEFEGEEVGTVFDQRGIDGRLEAVHRPLALGGGQLDGVFGLQWERARFAADGEEAFVPGTHTSQVGLFMLERWRRGDTQLSAGLRRESVEVRSDGDAADADEPRFGAPQSRRFQPLMASLGAAQTLAAGWELALTLSHSERAPTFYELYADGVHVATAAYERGDPGQRTERGRHAELSLNWARGAHSVQASVFQSRFSRYLALLPTGETFVDGDESFPVYAFEGVAARLRGWELDGRWRAVDGPWRLDLGLRADGLRADNLSRGEPLPRIAPWRVALTADLQRGPWGVQVQWRHAAGQTRVPADDRPTAGWSMLDLALTWSTRAAGQPVLLFLRGSNLGDTLAYNASTTATLRGLSPLAGRAVNLGLQLRW